MKKITLFFLFLITTAYADNVFLANQTTYPDKNTKLAVEWASSAQEVDASNKALMSGDPLNPASLQPLSQPGKTTLTIPKNAQYFRVLAWTNGHHAPDLLTNWVDITPNKTYNLTADHLVPTVLLLGTGC